MRKLLFLLLLLIPAVAHGQGTQIQSGPTNPATCQPGALFYNTTLSAQQQCGPAANTWVNGTSASNGVGGTVNSAAPTMAFYFAPQCLVANTGQCYQTFADAQQTNACSWSNVSTTITCLSEIISVSGSVTSNVATYTFYTVIPSGWASGQSITIAGFTGGDTYLNQTCNITTVTSAATGSTITCPLTHANGSSTTAGAITNSAVGPFVAGDVGKSVMGGNTCVADTVQASMGGEISTTTTPTISTFISSTQVTISATPGASVTQRSTFPPGGCFIWGHLDDANAVLLDAALQASSVCPKVFFSASSYFFQSPHFFNNPPACANISSGIFGTNSGGLGNVTLAAGLELEGRGRGNTVWYIAPSFPNGDTCAHKPQSGNTTLGVSQPNGGCFVITEEGGWTDLRLDGGAQTTAPNLNNKILLYASVAHINRITCANLGPYNASGMVGLQMNFQVMLDDFDNAGCGTIGLETDTNTSLSVGKRVVVENSATNALLLASGSDFTCYWCDLALPAAGNNVKTILNNGGTLKMFGGRVLTTNIGSGSGTGIILYTDAGPGTLDADAVQFDLLTFPSNSGLFCSVAGCRMSLVNGSKINNPSSNSSYADTGGGTLFIDGSFSYTGTFSNANISGNIVADGHSLRGTCTGTATATSTLGLYGTGPNETLTTCTSTTIGSGIPMTQARTASVLMVSATHAGVNASSGVVTVLKNGVATTITCTIGTGTVCSDFTHTVAFAAGDLLSLQFTTQAVEVLAGVQAQILWQ